MNNLCYHTAILRMIPHIQFLSAYRSSDVTTSRVVVVWQMMSQWTHENNNQINVSKQCHKPSTWNDGFNMFQYFSIPAIEMAKLGMVSNNNHEVIVNSKIIQL